MNIIQLADKATTPSRKLRYQTWLINVGPYQWAIRHRETDIIVYDQIKHTITVDTKGWLESNRGLGWTGKTMPSRTTRDRLNDYLPASYRLYQKAKRVFWQDGTPFSDGAIIEVR